MNRSAYLLGATLVTLLAVSLICAAAYHLVMFGSGLTRESLTETLNYALQTITTVGYGNWVPAGWNVEDMAIQKRILYVKAISLPFMLVGGTLFAVLVGIVSNLLSRR